MKIRFSMPLILLPLFLAACSGQGPVMNHGGMMMNHGGMQTNGDTSSASAPQGFLPGAGKDVASLPEAQASQIMTVESGQTITLNPTIVKKTINGKAIAMYGYNGQIPGPLLKVKQGSTFTVNITNSIDLPTTIHWHGVRLQNQFDGVPGLTQKAIEPGGTFQYTITVPDEGMYWYHPHVREDIEQNAGLYGNILVTLAKADASTVVNDEKYLMLGDLLLNSDGSPMPYGANDANLALMGRFGNVFLVNGSAPYSDSIQKGSIVRYYLTNVSNTRTLNLRFGNAKMKLVGGDSGLMEKEKFIQSVILAPAERAIVDVSFETAGTYTIRTDDQQKQLPLGTLTVIDQKATPSYSSTFSALHTAKDVVASIDSMRPSFDKPVDETLHLTVKRQGMMAGMQHEMAMSKDGIEWEDPMPQVNADATKENTQWKFVDEVTKAENMDIKYTFKKGDKVKIRLVNDEQNSDHPMQHPIHFHGQRFLVLSDNGVKNTDLVWKDTVLVPAGHTVDILLDASNPGDWMFHCHISEHLTNGMMGEFHVQ